MEGSAATQTGKPAGETPPGSPSPTPPPPETPPPANPPAPSGSGGSGSGNGETAAEKRIRELNDRMKAAEERAEQAEAKIREAEKAKMGDLERAQADAKEAREEAERAKARATTLERGGWARAAASELGFVDPEDAVAMVDLGSLDTQTKVKNAVERLKEQKPHLIREGAGQAPGAVPPPGVPGFGNLGGVGQQQGAEIPVGPDGEPDHKLGLGRELFGALTGRRQA